MGEELKEKVNQWIIKAENDINSANYLLLSEKIICDTICFHCQQASEKYLKAYIVSRNIVPLKTHKLSQILYTCISIDSSFEELTDTVFLTEYAVDIRYADDFLIPTVEDALEAFEMANKVKQFVLKLL